MPENTATANPQYRTPQRQEDLPEIAGYGWELHHYNHYDCGTTTVNPWRKRSIDNADQTPGEDSFECVIANAAAYLEANGIQELDVPQYYSRFHEEFEPVIAEWTVRKHGIAIGVNSTLLELAVRLANGKGRINHTSLEVHLCEDNHLFVAGNRGVFLVDLWPLKAHSLNVEPPVAAYTEIQGFDIPEDDPDLQEGLRRFIHLFNEYADTTLESYESAGDSRHTFQTKDGDAVYANAFMLKRLAGMVLDERDCHGSYSYEYDDTTYSSTWDETTAEYAIGEEHFRGIVIGYEHRWREEDYVMGNELYQLHSEIRYVCLDFQPEKYSHYDVRVVTVEEDIDTFEPQEEA